MKIDVVYDKLGQFMITYHLIPGSIRSCFQQLIDKDRDEYWQLSFFVISLNDWLQSLGATI